MTLTGIDIKRQLQRLKKEAVMEKTLTEMVILNKNKKSMTKKVNFSNFVICIIAGLLFYLMERPFCFE